MIVNINHQTSYRYADCVSMCQNLLRLRPRNHIWQTLLQHDLTITPNPSSTNHYLDFFANHVTWISLLEHHDHFHIDANSRVQIHPRPAIDLTTSTPWEQVRDQLAVSPDSACIGARQYVFDSPHVNASLAATGELLDYARASFHPGRPIFDAAAELTTRICNDFAFTPGSTDLNTPISQTLATRQGVCQDFAHLQIGLLRSLGLAARYVSGYLITRPPPGQPRLTGADASHAWISLFDPSLGWVDFDPTNGLLPTDKHITIGWARDYHEISPVRGITVGGSSQWLGVTVDVTPEPETPSPQSQIDN
jgi:transglutaminase-like putative cysteine protease